MQGGGRYCSRRRPCRRCGWCAAGGSLCRCRSSSLASADHQLAGTSDSLDSQLRVSHASLARHEGCRTALPRAWSLPAALAIACRRKFRAPQARLASKQGSTEPAAAAGARRKCDTVPPLLGLHGLSELGSGGRGEQNQGGGRVWSSKKALPQFQGGGTSPDRCAHPSGDEARPSALCSARGTLLGVAWCAPAGGRLPCGPCMHGGERQASPEIHQGSVPAPSSPDQLQHRSVELPITSAGWCWSLLVLNSAGQY
jgi:hypothetical protein